MDPRCSFLREVPAGAKLPLDATFKFDVGSVPMHYWPAKRGTDRPPESFTLFILGNPGVLDYYTPFLNFIHEQVPDSHALLCMSHVGGDMRIPGPAQALDLMENLKTKVELAEALRASLTAWAAEVNTPEPRLNLMGHSIGAWMCVEVMKQVKVHAGYLLFPTLGWIANSYNGWKLWPVFHRPVRPLLPLLAGLVGPIVPYLPINLPPTTLAFLRSPHTIANVLHLARSEMHFVRGPDLEWYYAQRDRPLGSGVYGVWSAGNLDGWVGEDGPMIRDCIGKKRYRQLEGVPHAFCLNEKHSEQVADLVTHWMTMDKPNGKI